MLTSYHYLLGSLMAVSCVTSAFFTPPSQHTSSPAEQTIDVAYRGSGRLDEAPGRSQTGSKNLSQAMGQNAEQLSTATDMELNAELSSALDTNLSAATTEEDSFLLSHRGSGRITPAMTTRL